MNELLTFVAGAAIGGLLSWLITHRYYVKSGSDQKTELAKLQAALRPRNTLRDFEDFLGTSTWTKSFVGHAEIWMADADNTFQIEQGESSREFRERWTTVYPDPNSTAYPVYLKINGTTIKEVTFISMDGGRIFVPMTETRLDATGTPEYFWNLSGLEVRVCRIIGSYYIHENLEGVARTSNVVLVE
jgi:hypothetical protein